MSTRCRMKSLSQEGVDPLGRSQSPAQLSRSFYPTTNWMVRILFVLGLGLAWGTGTLAPAPAWGHPPLAVQESPSNAPPATDPSLNAESDVRPIKAEKKGMNVLSLLVDGGWFMIPLTLLSLAVAALVVERLFALRRDRLLPEKLIRRLGQLGDMPGGMDPREAFRICQSHPSAGADVLRDVLLKVGRPHSELEATLHESAQRRATAYQQMVSWLTLAAAVAPLIGLLGTVWGITQSFHDTTQLEVGQNRAEALSHGIYTALVTTICGLLIAIPATIGSHFFENRIVSLFNQIEEMILSLLPQLERYEGQVRFSNSNHHDEAFRDSVSEPPATPLPRPPSRTRKEPMDRPV